MESEGVLNILSSPSITTLDNKMAYTENGEKVPYVSKDDDGDTSVKFEDAVLRLEMTPNVIDPANLKLKVLIKKDEVDASRSVQGNPYIVKKQTETTVLVRSGETIVISGLTKEKGTNQEAGVPGMRDLPGGKYEPQCLDGRGADLHHPDHSADSRRIRPPFRSAASVSGRAYARQPLSRES